MRTKNQHYVPQFLLEHFVPDGTKTIFVYDKRSGRNFSTIPRNLASEVGFYDYKASSGGQSFETALSKIEAATAPVIGQIVKNRSLGGLSKSDASLLCYFTAVQMLRVRQAREVFQFMHNSIADAIGKRFKSPLIQQTCRLSEDQLHEANVRQVTLAKSIAEILVRKDCLVLQTAQGNSFVTSDNPVVMYNEFGGNIGVGVAGVVINFPLAPEVCLMFVDKEFGNAIIDRAYLWETYKQDGGLERPPFDISELQVWFDAISQGTAVTAGPENLIHCNSLQIAQSSRYIFQAQPNFDFVETVLREEPDLKNSPMPEIT